jgi:outer membrane biosynthesis protein TonB
MNAMHGKIRLDMSVPPEIGPAVVPRAHEIFVNSGTEGDERQGTCDVLHKSGVRWFTRAPRWDNSGLNSAALFYPEVPRLDRRIVLAIAVSIALHVAIVAIPVRPGTSKETIQAMQAMPLSVRIVEPAPPAREPEPPRPPPVVEPAPVPRATPRPRERKPEPAPVPPPPVPEAPLEPVPVPDAKPALVEPPVDMLAAIEARRAKRREADAALRRRLAVPEPESKDAALESINRNLQTLTASEAGVSGVFQILHKGTRSGEFAFNGWRPGSRQQWRQVIEVDAGPGGDVERAIVRRMIELIRTHYTGDFNWLSQRLGRTVVLSARPADQEGLEEFLLREFFGTPTVKQAQPGSASSSFR